MHCFLGIELFVMDFLRARQLKKLSVADKGALVQIVVQKWKNGHKSLEVLDVWLEFSLHSIDVYYLI
jgi:hypothetical protein